MMGYRASQVIREIELVKLVHHKEGSHLGEGLGHLQNLKDNSNN